MNAICIYFIVNFLLAAQFRSTNRLSNKYPRFPAVIPHLDNDKFNQTYVCYNVQVSQ